MGPGQLHLHPFFPEVSQHSVCAQVGQSTEEQADGANILGDAILTGGNLTPIAKFSKGDKVGPAHVPSVVVLPSHDAHQDILAWLQCMLSQAWSGSSSCQGLQWPSPKLAFTLQASNLQR